MKKCLGCIQDKELSQFGKQGTGLRPRCKECMRIDNRHRYVTFNRDKRDPSKILGNHLKLKFGITLDQYNQMLISQNGKCAICKNVESAIDHRSKKIKNLSVDHDHETLKIRGLLCLNCNRGIGYLKDNPEILKTAADYVERSKCE